MKEVALNVSRIGFQGFFSDLWKSFVSNVLKKVNISQGLCFVVLSLTACTHPMIGKVLPAANYPQFTSGTNGHHLVNFERGIANLDYDWFINQEENSLTLIGIYKINTTEWTAFTSSLYKCGQVTIAVILLDKDYEIVKVETIFFPIDADTTIEKTNRFSKTFPYNGEYKFVTFKLMYKGLY